MKHRKLSAGVLAATCLLLVLPLAKAGSSGAEHRPDHKPGASRPVFRPRLVYRLPFQDTMHLYQGQHSLQIKRRSWHGCQNPRLCVELPHQWCLFGCAIKLGSFPRVNPQDYGWYTAYGEGGGLVNDIYDVGGFQENFGWPPKAWVGGNYYDTGYYEFGYPYLSYPAYPKR